MEFKKIDWFDSDLLSIHLEYDRAILNIWNDTLEKNLYVHCMGLIGVDNLCIWDDTIICDYELCKVGENEIETEYLRQVFQAYEKNSDAGGRKLSDGILKLKITLTNHIPFCIYCQKIDVSAQSD